MKPFSYHVHTQFCDGRSSAEEMVLAAIENGFDSLGFSSHSNLPSRPELYGMKKENVEPYCREVLRLKEVYKDKINIILGIEQDSFGDGRNQDAADCFTEFNYLNSEIHR